MNCVIIGEGTLPLRCAQLWVEAGHTIVAVVSADTNLQSWAQTKHIPTPDGGADLAELLSTLEFDYLFSIVNPHILPARLLQIPNKMAINYHDGPLPRYAGTHATSWAILNGETEHGIVWHAMTAQVDAGDILIQRRVAILPDDSVMTLNARCYAAAVAAFEKLIPQLADGTVVRTKQDRSRRTFFGRTKPLPAAGVIDWRQPAEQLSQLARATQTGPYPNRLGVPRLWTGESWLVVSELDIGASGRTEPVGTVIAVGNDDVEVVVGERDSAEKQTVIMRGLLTLSAVPADLTAFIVGDRLPVFEAATLRKLENANRRALRHERYWVNQFRRARVASLPHLPLETNGPAHSYQVAFSDNVLDFLTRYSAAPRTALLTLLMCYLARINDGDQIAVGLVSPINARLTALFSPVAPLVVDVDLEHPFSTALTRVQTQCAQNDRRMSYSHDLFLRYPDLEPQSWPIIVSFGSQNAWAQDPSTIHIQVDLERKTWAWHHCSEVSARTVLDSVMTSLDALSASIIAHPERKLTMHAVLSEAQQQKMVMSWNATGTSAPRATSLHGWFEAQAQRSPHAVALITGDTELSYRELAQRANQLAHLLGHQGVGPGDRVAICLDRSAELVIALLAVLKAGAAYVPLDPTYPADRLRFMLDDCMAALLITTSQIEYSAETSTATILLDDLDEILADLSTEPPKITQSAETPAYILYTSGSTGRPKGSLISHRAIVNHMQWLLRQFELKATDVVLQKTPFSFDASVWEFYAPLLSGGQLVLARPDGHRDPNYLSEAIQRHRVTILQLVPTQLRMLLETPEFAACKTLRHVFCGGEPLPAQLVNRFHDTLPATLTNLYGPSECAIDTTFHVLERSVQRDPVPIGRPIDNASVYVVDCNDQLVPVGVAGELLIGGAGVGSGYWRRDSLSAEKFIPLAQLPWATSLHGVEYETLYRSGDRVRWQADGTLVFLGRGDEQIKLRGHRVELGEIEAALDSLETIYAAAVTVDHSRGKQQLVAYVVATDRTRDRQSVQARLREMLPEFMIPTRIVWLETMPLLPNGKVDRSKLTGVGDTAQVAAAELPRDEIEAMLSTLWCDLLALESVGRHDEFFALGGDSLAAMRLANRIQELFGIAWSLGDQFATPTIAQTASAIRNREPGSAIAPADAARETGRIPLSSAQLRLWLMTTIHDVDPAYNVQVAFRLRGDLDADALTNSLRWLLARHAILRTSIRVADGEPEQVINNDVSLDLQLVSVSDEPQLQAQMTALAQTRFDLSDAPLLRARLYHVGSQQHVLQLTMHHIIIDSWSTDILLRDLSTAYTAFAQDERPVLQGEQVDYATYARWQRAFIASGAMSAARAYWMERFSAETVPLRLPLDHPRPKIQTFAGHTLTVRLPEKLMNRVIEHARQYAATPYMWLLATYFILLARRTRQSDIVVGSPSANRFDGAVAETVGFFVNTLALRIDLSGNPTFANVLKQVRDIVLGATANQRFPFDRLVDALQLERDLSRSPLFQTWFAVHYSPNSALVLPDTHVQVIDVAHNTAKFDLSLYVEYRDNQWLAHWEYNTDLLDRSSIERMARQWKIVLSGSVTGLETPVELLPLMDSAEKRLVVHGWNQTTVAYDLHRPLHDWVSAQAERTPNAIGVVFPDASGDQTLTYAELERSTNQLANHLLQLGIGPGIPVGIFMQRSVEMVIAIHAVVKAGGAYMPLEPTYPDERLTLMLADAKPPVILTQRDQRDQLPSTSAIVIALDDDQRWQRQASTRPDTAVTPDSVAYIMYTSGSTGQPKGVLNTHAGIVNRLLWMQDRYKLDNDDCVLQKTPFSFDVSVWEFFWPLMTGATLIIAKPEGHKDDTYLQDIISKYNITTLHFVPSMLRSFLDQLEPEACRSLKRVICSGEALPFSTQERFFQLLNAELHNLYGPTEAAIDVSAWHCKRSDPRGIVPIGRPIANIQLYILDDHLQPVPIGTPGELYIGGVGVARGYLNRPKLTAERFLPDPFRAEPDARLYRTGDWVRFLPDGNIEFFGRIDTQVKIRGFRIELGDVEAALGRHPAVAAAVATILDNGDDPSTLVAHVVFSGGRQATVMELRSFLAEIVPEHMIPAHFVWLDALPLTANGKLDRKALPSVDKAQLPLGSTYQPAQTSAEKHLATLWSNVLGQQAIGIDDNFFALGGDSIRALQVIHGARHAFPTATVTDLFKHQTIRTLAALWQTDSDEQAATKLPARAALPTHLQRLVPTDAVEAYPATAMQRRVIAAYEADLERIGVYHFQQVHRIEEATFSADLMQQALDHQIANHPALRTQFIRANDELVQVVKRQQSVPVTVVDDDMRAVLLADRLQPFDPFSDAPLIRVYVGQDSAETHYMATSFHHAIIDGWGNIQLINALFDSYSDLNCGRPLLAASADPSMRQYVALEAEIAQEDAARSFWQTALAQHVSQSIPQQMRGSGSGNYVVALDAEALRGVQHAAREKHVAVKAVFLAAYLRALAIICGRRQITVGIVANGRSDRMSNPLGAVGLFWNMVPFVSNAPDTADFGKYDLIADVQARLVAMESFVRYPVEKDLAGSAFWATFNFVHFHNARQVTHDGTIRYTHVAGFDKFHYPFNLTVRFDSATDSAELRAEFDGRQLGRAGVQTVVETMIKQLRQFATIPKANIE